MSGRVVADISMSIDGFVTGPDAGPEAGLGVGGEPIHRWVMEQSPVDAEVLRQAFDTTGAVVMGRRLFDVIDGPHGWDDDHGYGYDQDQSAAPPVVVVTHTPPTNPRHTSRFLYVDGLEPALDLARSHAGDRDVVVMGGGDVVGQVLAAGLADELRLHVSPIVLGAGTPLFHHFTGPAEWEQVEAIVSPNAVHLVYRPRH